MVDILTTEAEDNNYPISGEQPQEIKITIPMSQLFYFHSPLSWAKVVKLEYEPLVLSTSANENEQEGGEDQDEESTVTTEDQIPIRNFAIVYSSDIADFSTGLHVSFHFCFFTRTQNLHLLIPSPSASLAFSVCYYFTS